MEKNKLIDFINKYSLGGAIEQVKWKFKKDSISVISTTVNTNAYCNITMHHDLQKTIKESKELYVGIQKTSQLKKLISVLNDNIDIIPHINTSNVITHMEITDDIDTVYFATMDSSIVADLPNIKPKGTKILEIKFTEEMVNKFIKAKNALSEYESFHIIYNKDGNISLNLGYSSKNTNRIAININQYINLNNVPPEIDFSALSFNAEYLKQIISSNEESLISGLILEVYYVDDDIYMGMINIPNNDIFESSYALFKSSNIES